VSLGRHNGPMASRFFKNDDFEFRVQFALGGLPYGLGDAGELLATVDAIKNGDNQEWFAQFTETAKRVHAIADDCAERGYVISARDAYLRASCYYSYALEAIQALPDTTELLPTFSAHRECWDNFAARHDPPIERVAIPYESTTMPGYFIKPDDSSEPRPTIVLNNGSDGPITSMWPSAKAAIERGYNALVFDGPGQQHMLFVQDIPFRPDWEAVITPVVDYLSTRNDVDTEKLALYGISQGGYWVPRALVFEHRFAAAVADPGVVDVSSSWTDHLPHSLLKPLDSGDEAKFNKEMELGLKVSGLFSKGARETMAFRTRPYGVSTAYEAFKAVSEYNISDIAHEITTPLMICDPEGEQFWPGQPKRLFDLVSGPKVLVAFTKSEGADRHCEPMARTLLDQRMYDWLAATLGL